MNRSQVVQAVESSPEYHRLVVEGLYQSLLRRAVDPVGLTGWTRFLDQGGTQDDLRAQILGSEEYFQRRGGGTKDGFLSALYSDVLGRSPDPNGVRGWSNRLEDASRTEVAGDVIDSREAAMLDVVALYGRFLHRNPDAIGFNASVAALQDGVLQAALIATIVGSDEFFNHLAV